MKKTVTDEQIDTIRKMIDLKRSVTEIANAVELNYPVTSYWVRKIKNPSPKVSLKKCRTCQYYCKYTHSCDFILLALKMRECDPHDCKEYVAGEYTGKLPAMTVSKKRPKKEEIPIVDDYNDKELTDWYYSTDIREY